MKYFKKHQSFSVFYENEGDKWGPLESETTPWTPPPKTEVPQSQNQINQEKIDKKKGSFIEAQNKTIQLAQTYEQVANEKVEVVLRSTPLYKDLSPDKRREKIQELIHEFLENYREVFLKERERLTAEWLPVGEIQALLTTHEENAFKDFLNQKMKEAREKWKESRLSRYQKALIVDDDAIMNQVNQKKIKDFSYDYSLLKREILEANPELENDPKALNKEIQKKIDTSFIAYCEKEWIPIDISKLEWEPSEIDQADIGDTPLEIESTKGIMMLREEYIESAKHLSAAAQEYQWELSEYEKIVPNPESDNSVVYDLPRKIIDLPPGETASFIGTSGSSDVVYEAYREPDGEYTIKFNGTTLKDLPKKEMEVVVDLNATPVINTIFTVNSELYRTLLREYKTICMASGTDALENPPLGFIDFLYGRLNDAYLSTMPEEETSLLWLNLSDMPYKDRWKYIRSVLSTNIDLRSTVIKKLEAQKILVGGRINLSKYPR